VTIDGEREPNVDLYAATAQGFQLGFARLSSKTHTIVITVSGTKDSASSGTAVAVDAFIVGSTIIQESSPNITYDRWTGAKSTLADGGTYRSNGTKNATSTLSFMGTGVVWITATGPAYGMASVSVDGVNMGTVNLYASSRHWQVAESYLGLAAGTHTILVTVLGTKKASSKGTQLVVDAFVVDS
jgi:hypothetical protein